MSLVLNPPSLTPKELAGIARAYYAEMNRRGVWLYAIQAGPSDGPVKIGITNSPATRLKTLQQANAEKLHGLAAWRGLPEDEKLIHRQFEIFRLEGEWFAPDPELIEFVLWEGGIFCDWEEPRGKVTA